MNHHINNHTTNLEDKETRSFSQAQICVALSFLLKPIPEMS